MMNETLPILRRTEMLTIRNLGGRQVFAYHDLAEGFQVDASIVRRQFSRNAAAWEADETGVSQNDSGQETRWFTARGAMRFCRYVKSGRSDALFNHLLDLWEAERGAVAPRDPLGEVDKMAAILTPALVAITGAVSEVQGRIAEQGARLAAVEEQQRITDPLEIERRMHFLENCKTLLVFGTRGQPQPVTFPGYWRELKNLIGIASFQNRAVLTVPMMDKCVAYAARWCEARGVNPPTLFDQVDKAI